MSKGCDIARNDNKAKAIIIGLLISIGMVISLMPALVFGETEEPNIVYVSGTRQNTSAAVTGLGTEESPYNDLETALQKVKSGGTIRIKDSISSPQLSEDTALKIIKPVTITGGEFNCNYAGIILGADVTFENMSIGFKNVVRNAIIANGYNLTLNGVTTTENSSTSIHVFCGSITSFNSAPAISTSSEASTLTIKGKNSLGNIYAGSLSDGENESTAAENSFERTVNIVIENDVSGTVGNIYSCGAREARGESKPDIFYEDASKYIVNSSVNVKLKGSLIKNVYGETGGTGKTLVEYEDTKGYPVSDITLKNIAALSVKGIGDLKPAIGSSFVDNVDLGVDEEATLNLSNMGESLAVNNFIGGGTLVMAEAQTMAINGTVSGTTTVGIGEITLEKLSKTSLEEGVSYITVPQNSGVTGEEFEFLWGSNVTWEEDVIVYVPIYDADKKAWITTCMTYRPEVESFDITPKEISLSHSAFNLENEYGAEFSISAELSKAKDTNKINYIPFKYSVKNILENKSYDVYVGADEYGYYGSVDELGMMLAVFNSDKSGEWEFCAYSLDYSVPEGKYEITVSYDTVEGPVDRTITLNIIDTLKITAITSPQIESLTEFYDNAEDIIELELPKTISATTEEGDKEFAIRWSCSQYDKTAGASNTFTWEISDDLSEYDVSGNATTGSVVIKNKAAIDISTLKGKCTLEKSAYTYNGTAKKPTVEIEGLTEGTGFTVKYTNNTNAGTATVTVTGKGNYTGSFTKSFTINKASIKGKTATLSATSYSYNGNARKPIVKAVSGVAAGNYRLSYYKNSAGTKVTSPKYPGTYTAVIAGTNNYTGTITKTFTIKKPVVSTPSSISVRLAKGDYDGVYASWSKVTVAGATVKYKVQYRYGTGSWNKTPKVTANRYYTYKGLTDGKKVSIKVTPYVVVNGKTYNGTGKISTGVYTLKELGKPTVKKYGTKVKVTWSKISGASGYRLSQSTKRTGTNPITLTTGNSKILKATKGKTYYYKVQAYKNITISGKTYKVYGPWSTAVEYKRK